MFVFISKMHPQQSMHTVVWQIWQEYMQRNAYNRTVTDEINSQLDPGQFFQVSAIIIEVHANFYRATQKNNK